VWDARARSYPWLKTAVIAFCCDVSANHFAIPQNMFQNIIFFCLDVAVRCALNGSSPIDKISFHTGRREFKKDMIIEVRGEVVMDQAHRVRVSELASDRLRHLQQAWMLFKWDMRFSSNELKEHGLMVPGNNFGARCYLRFGRDQGSLEFIR